MLLNKYQLLKILIYSSRLDRNCRKDSFRNFKSIVISDNSIKMPKNKKADTSDSDSGPEDRLPAKKSKPAPSAKSSTQNNSSEDELSWPIDKRRFIKLREFNRKWMVDIREYYDADGDLKPGKKGIALSIPQWQKLKDIVNEVDEAIKKNV